MKNISRNKAKSVLVKAMINIIGARRKIKGRRENED
jgi:hypothetical protein